MIPGQATSFRSEQRQRGTELALAQLVRLLARIAVRDVVEAEQKSTRVIRETAHTPEMLK